MAVQALVHSKGAISFKSALVNAKIPPESEVKICGIHQSIETYNQFLPHYNNDLIISACIEVLFNCFNTKNHIPRENCEECGLPNPQPQQ
jgi:hypothetical protein